MFSWYFAIQINGPRSKIGVTVFCCAMRLGNVYMHRFGTPITNMQLPRKRKWNGRKQHAFAVFRIYQIDTVEQT